MKSHGRRLRGRALVTTYYDDVKTRLHLSVQCAVHDDGELVTFELVSVEVVVLGETRDFTAISGVTVCSLGSGVRGRDVRFGGKLSQIGIKNEQIWDFLRSVFCSFWRWAPK